MKTNSNRLTYADKDTGTVFSGKSDTSIPCGDCPFKDRMNCDDCAFSQIIEKLYAYEKSGYTPEEVSSGRMVYSPLTVGDMVYHIRTDEGKPYIEESRVGLVKLSYLMDNGTGWRDSWELQVDNYGVTTFPSKEEAERVLKEMKQNVT